MARPSDKVRIYSETLATEIINTIDDICRGVMDHISDGKMVMIQRAVEKIIVRETIE